VPCSYSEPAPTTNSYRIIEDVMIDGYEDSPLIDGTPFLSDPLFWSTYFSDTMASSEPARVADAFEVDARACEGLFERLTSPDAWPAFRIGLRDGHDAYVIYRNEPDEETVEFVLSRPGGVHTLALANTGGNEHRPGLSWSELVAVANQPGAAPGVAEPDARLLLLLPAFGDADLSDDATAVVTAALRRHGAGPGAGDLAAWFLEDPEDWPHWRLQDDDVLVCDDRYSRRNPQGHAGHPPADLREISSALATG
jgi:hypothetical protein